MVRRGRSAGAEADMMAAFTSICESKRICCIVSVCHNSHGRYWVGTYKYIIVWWIIRYSVHIESVQPDDRGDHRYAADHEHTEERKSFGPLKFQLPKSAHRHNQDENIGEDVDRSHREVCLGKIVTSFRKGWGPGSPWLFSAFEGLGKSVVVSGRYMVAPHMTYIDKCDNDCLNSNKAGYTVHSIAELGLGEDSVVEGQNASFDEEQCPWVHKLIRIPEAE